MYSISQAFFLSHLEKIAEPVAGQKLAVFAADWRGSDAAPGGAAINRCGGRFSFWSHFPPLASMPISSGKANADLGQEWRKAESEDSHAYYSARTSASGKS